MVKPDGVVRGLIGDVVGRFERRGLKLVAMKMLRIPQDLAERHYREHTGKSFFHPLVNFITSAPVVAMVLEGDNAVQVVRDMMGKTDPQKSAPGTIRADLAMSTARNVIHGSDSEASAEREIALFFTTEELVEYPRADEAWLYGK
jgi:nucleoside-diphosphate kinase